MKRVKHLLAFVLALGMMLAALPGVQAAEEYVTATRAIQVSDTEIVIEFSEPIAIDFHQEGSGPWISVRLMNASDVVQYHGEGDSRTAMQWAAAGIEFLDDNRDRLLYTIRSGAFGVETINDVTGFRGVLAQYKDMYKVRLSVEEKPYDTSKHRSDGFVCNISSLDGTKPMLATVPRGYDATCLDIVRNYNYEFDRTKCFPIDAPSDDAIGMIVGATPIEKEEDPVDIRYEEVVKNDPVYILIWLGAAVALALVLILLLPRFFKKGEKS